MVCPESPDPEATRVTSPWHLQGPLVLLLASAPRWGQPMCPAPPLSSLSLRPRCWRAYLVTL